MKRSSLLLCLATALPAAGLALLTLRATGAEEERADLRAREVLSAAAEALRARAVALLREADQEADSENPSAPAPRVLLREVFVADAEGDILLPVVARYPPATPPPETEAARLRAYLEQAARESAATASPLEAAPFLEPAIAEFAHPDLLGSLLDALAGYYESGGRADRAALFYGEIATHLPGARSLAGEPLAPRAHERLLALRPPAERGAEALLFAGRLADDAWGMAPAVRDGRLAALAAALGPEGLPEEVAARADLVTALRSRVLPETIARLSRADAAEWRHLAWTGPRGPEVLGSRGLALSGGMHAFGYLLDHRAFAARLAAVARDLAEAHSLRVSVDLAPRVVAGRDIPRPAIRLDTDLGGDLGAIRLTLLGPAPAGLAGLRFLQIAMTLLLLLALATGGLLSLRAVRRETEAARVRQQFVDNVSHELRTPLTSIRLYGEMLAEEDALSDADRRRYLAWILRESERLSRLVEDVLDFSRVSRGEAAFSLSAVDPPDLAERALALVGPLAAERGLVLRAEVPPGLPAVRADRDAALRILVNLLANAVEYSGDGREAGLAVRAGEGAVEFTVWDRGPGIPPEERERLFTRFFRGSRDLKKVRGMGLGLTLSREIARALGGDLDLLDTGPSGSRFALRLPAAGDGGVE